MVGSSTSSSEPGNDNVNEECDHRGAILEGLGEQLHPIEERMEHLEAADHEELHQEMESHFGFDCYKQCGIGVSDPYGAFKKLFYCVSPIYDKEQADHDGLHSQHNIGYKERKKRNEKSDWTESARIARWSCQTLILIGLHYQHIIIINARLDSTMTPRANLVAKKWHLAIY